MVRNDSRGSGRVGAADGGSVAVGDEDGGDEDGGAEGNGVADGGGDEEDREGVGSAAHPAPTTVTTSVATTGTRRRTRAISPR